MDTIGVHRHPTGECYGACGSEIDVRFNEDGSATVGKIAQAHLSDVRDDVLPRAKSEYRFDLVDALAMHEMAHVLWEGEQKYGLDNWRRIPIENHLSHMIGHAYAWMAGDRSVAHLAHALCNAMFACALEQRPDYRGAAEGQTGNTTASEFRGA